jgi:hypothetical protein
MTDRELLELAAKAAGAKPYDWENSYDGLFIHSDGEIVPYERGEPGFAWDPLTDDGDALRLAMSLELGVVCKRESDPYEKNRSVVTDPYRVGQLRIVEPHKYGPEAATRRAIVRAAAEIGRTMP